MSRWAWLLVSLAILFGSGVARAQTAEEVAVAQQLFQEAVEAQSGKEWALCEERLTAALAIKETPGLRYHLAFCKERQLRWVEALVDYRRVRELLTAGQDAPDVAEMLGPSIAHLEKATPSLRIVLVEPPGQTHFYLDGKEWSAVLNQRRVPIDPGAHVVSISAPGYESFVQRLTVLEGDERMVDVVLIPLESLAPAQPQAPPKPVAYKETVTESRFALQPRTVVLIAEGSLLLLGASVGAYFTFAERRADERRERLRQEVGSSAECLSGSDSACAPLRREAVVGEKARIWSNAAYVGLGISSAALLTTWLVWESESSGLTGSIAPAASGALGTLSGRF